MVGAVRFELTTSCTRNKFSGLCVVAHSCIWLKLPRRQYARAPL